MLRRPSVRCYAARHEAGAGSHCAEVLLTKAALAPGHGVSVKT
jgi:hypothetical protein